MPTARKIRKKPVPKGVERLLGSKVNVHSISTHPLDKTKTIKNATLVAIRPPFIEIEHIYRGRRHRNHIPLTSVRIEEIPTLVSGE